MANSFFVYNNLAVQFGTIKNGTGSFSARVEDAAFPMENLLNPSRSVLWKVPTDQGSAVNVEIDLGASMSIRALGLLGVRKISNPALTPIGASGVTVKSSTSATPPPWGDILGGTTFLQTNARNTIDTGVILASAVSMRTIQFAIHNPAAFTAAGILIAGADIDMTKGFSPSSDFSRERARTVTRNPFTGTPQINDYGLHYQRFALRFDNVQATEHDKLMALVGSAGRTFFYFDPTGALFEGFLTGSGLKWDQKVTAGATALFNDELNFEQVP